MPEKISLPTSFANLIPVPVSALPAEGHFQMNRATQIVVEPNSAELRQIGEYLAERLRPATGFSLPVQGKTEAPADNRLLLSLKDSDPGLGTEGYALTIQPEGVQVSANKPAGLFYAVQTLRQLLPVAIESAAPQPGPWELPAGTILDQPRFAWRGFMLDVSRHFFGVSQVKRVIELMAGYKMNRLHLHLSDDQGWRIEIKRWPNLATFGGSTEVGGGRGGYYTQADYAEIVAYAQSRYVVVVPEIDMPGHTNAALASYPELNCSGSAPDLYTGMHVGFSSLCIRNEITYRFIDDIIGELAAITPGAYVHIGGDEAQATGHEDYLYFVERVQAIVNAHGKQTVGWGEIAQARLLGTTLVQPWHAGNDPAPAIAQGAKLILSPASRVYLDMKYDENTPLGLNWAGYVNTRAAYEWDPASFLPGVPETSILGIEAPLWCETILNIKDIEFMVFPRLLGLAEIAWSPTQGRSWETYRLRLGAHAPRLQALGIHYYPDNEVPWK